MYIKHEVGRKGEEIVTKYLEQKNYIILDKNFFCKQGEIDIIAKDRKSKEIVFIEVKTRKQCFYGNPAEAVTKQKQKHILSVSKYYLYIKHLGNCLVRFDVIEVYLRQNTFKINHIKQAFYYE